MSEGQPTQGTRAIFLSYSREDTEAARRIADALRAFGMEVWFDQTELRGGDSWDAKIKRQIRECALFLPIISSHTQGRLEGYFRREWKLGVERTHDMAGGVAFIAPVVIDDTLESSALVPEEFMRYQWTRLPHGVPTPEFVAQLRKLLETPMKAAQPVGQSRAPAFGSTGSTASRPGGGMPGWAWGILGAAIVAAAAFFMTRKTEAPLAAAPAPTVESKAAPAVPAHEDKSVAVLPFDNMSEERDASAFFADGVQEDILTNLSFIHNLRVVSRTSVMQYRGTTKTIGQIAQELGVSYVLEGSVRRSGNKVRVTGQLIHAATDEHVWAKAYDRDITDVFAIQSELAQSIADALQAAISPAEQSLIDRRPTTSTAAYDAYIKARTGYEGTSSTVSAMIAEAQDAVELDPNFAEAWGLLAALQSNARFGELDTSEEAHAKARAAIDTAVRLAPEDPVVVEMQGDYFYYGDRDYDRAAERYHKLEALKPNSSDGFGSLGLIYRRQGKWAECEANLRKAIELDPRNMRYRITLAQHLISMNRFEDALAELRSISAIDPDDNLVQFYMAVVPFLATGARAEGDKFVARMKAEKPDDVDAIDFRKNWARLTGDYAEAVRLDVQLPYYDSGVEPHWAQEVNVAFDYYVGVSKEAGQERIKKVLPELVAKLGTEPNSALLWSDIGSCQAILGDEEEAVKAADKLKELSPESKDAVDGPRKAAQRAAILAWVGHKDEALAELARLLRTPYGNNVYIAANDADWLPIHGDPRFEALLNDPKNNQPLD